MANANVNTVKVPDIEIQAAMHKLLECSWFAADLFRLLDIHRSDEGAEGEITPATIGYLADTGVKMMANQLEIIERLAEYLSISTSVCDLTQKNILCVPDSSSVFSEAYREKLLEEKQSKAKGGAA